jgi:hypothetical protein
MKNFNHIHQVLTESGYPESNNSEWFIQIHDETNLPLMIPHWYDCKTKARAKVAVKSLLNKTDVYTVTVYSPCRNPVSFHGRFNELNEREWNYYYN